MVEMPRGGGVPVVPARTFRGVSCSKTWRAAGMPQGTKMKNRVFALAAGLVLSYAAHAQRVPVSTGEEVVVTATRLPQKLSDSSQRVTVITAEEIAAGGYPSLVELLQARAGVEITTSGGSGQPSAVFIRGAEARHTLVLIDGQRIGSATNGGTAYENIPLSQIERIEIVPGPLSSVYGSDAIGGVIQIFTRSGASGNSARVEAGSFGTRGFSAAFGNRTNDTEFSLSAGALESRSFDATKPTIPFAQHNPDTDRYRNKNFSARLAQHFAGAHELGATMFYSEGATHFDAGAATDDVNRQTLQAFSIYSRNPLSASWTSLVRFGTTRDDSSSVGAFPGYFRTDQNQATWQNDIQTPLGAVVAGLEYL